MVSRNTQRRTGGLTARKVRTLLIMLGPVLGAAGIVAAVGLNESAKGDVRQTLEKLGTNLIVPSATEPSQEVRHQRFLRKLWNAL
ncbi:MAG: hypothetical protein Ct9H90mP30_0310 [Actinomycetota bacterium]|nr:MAG: hypothetical protein Ct9H90mP30_0310 [Actinomycetota bacterium]